ncbi:hypothetical protein [Enterococcus sp. HY326]|uniref:hypothetical protein n=1 Tax=Enterococcus sp. HY326 TaxID=2971265 RepID=UPI002240870D|nr:hypothetical protein [Enterococcus sp. HY326]
MKKVKFLFLGVSVLTGLLLTSDIVKAESVGSESSLVVESPVIADEAQEYAKK